MLQRAKANVPNTVRIDWQRLDALRATAPWTDGDLLAEDRTLASWGKYRIVFGPFESPPNPNAQIVLIGLTPGLVQLRLANDVVREAMQTQITRGELAQRMRTSVAFVGQMRKNLVRMLDELGVADALGCRSTTAVFDKRREVAAATSALRYPVFVNGKNYRGDKAITVAPAFRDLLGRILAPLLQATPQALLVPFGKSVEAALDYLLERHLIQNEHVLRGFPHPSPANGHRATAFERNAEAMRAIVQAWRRHLPVKS